MGFGAVVSQSVLQTFHKLWNHYF